MFSGYRTAHMGWTNELKFYKNNAAGYGTATSNLDKDDFIVDDEKSKEILKGKAYTPKTDSWNDGNIKIIKPKKDQWNDGNIKIIEPKKEAPNVDSDDFILKDEDLNKILKGEPKAPKKDPWNDGNIKIIELKKEKEQPKNEMPHPNGPSEKENKPQPKDKMETPKPELEKKQEMTPKKEHSGEKAPKSETQKIIEPEVEKKTPHMERQSHTNIPKAHLESECIIQ